MASLFTVLSCQEDLDIPDRNGIVESISPQIGTEGDIITLHGTNMDQISSVSFNHKNTSLSEYNTFFYSDRFIEQNESELSFLLPELYHTDVLINGIDFNYRGFMDLKNFKGSNNMQILNEKIAFNNDDQVLYKSSDSFFSWTSIYEFSGNGEISSFYCLDEENIWIALQYYSGETGTGIYYSMDGGITFNLKYEVENPVSNMFFSTVSDGLFVDVEQNMYLIENDVITHIYNRYPELTNFPNSVDGLYDFTVIDTGSIIVRPNRGSHIIKIEDDVVTYYELDSTPRRLPVFFENTGFLETTNRIGNGPNDTEKYILKSEDHGESWNLIQTFENPYPYSIAFINKDVGLSFYPETESILITQDAGINWEEFSAFPDISLSARIIAIQENQVIFREEFDVIKYVH